MDVRLPGKETDAVELTPEKAEPPMEMRPSEKVTEAKDLMP